MNAHVWKRPLLSFADIVISSNGTPSSDTPGSVMVFGNCCAILGYGLGSLGLFIVPALGATVQHGVTI